MLDNSPDVVAKAVVLCKVVVKTLEDGRVALEKEEADNILWCVCVYARVCVYACMRVYARRVRSRWRRNCSW